MSQKDYGELFCQAVDEIVQQRLKAVKYDETILATIVDISQSDDGIYQVSDGSTRFEAHSSDTTYKVNDQVYVQIPMGDWNEQKLILSKKTGKNIAPVAYHRPFDSYVDVTNNVITKNLEVHGLVANDPTEEQSVVLWSYNTSLDKNVSYFEEGPELASYTRLGIQASFQSWLYDFNTVSGKYGIKLRVKAIKEDADDETEEILYYDYILDTSDMIGNPYNFESYFTQQKVFDISEIHKITEMELLFYEEPGTFFDKNGDQIPYLKEWSNDGDTEIYRVDDNIFVKDIFISFGYDVNEFEDNTIRIYTFDSSQYDRYLDPPENNHKELWLRWIKKDEDGNLRVISADDNLEYTILWYRKKLGVKSDTAYSGVDWKLLSTQEYKNGEYIYTINDENWLIYNQSAGVGYNRQPAYNSTWLIPNIDEATEQIKAIVMFEGAPYYSQNILEFTNKNIPISTPTLEAKNSLIINCEDGTYGNYCIYGTNGSLLDMAKGSETRTLRAYFKDPYLPESIPTQLTEAEWIEWTIPSQNTMFVIDEAHLGADYRIDLNGNYIITRYGIPSEKYNIVNQNSQNYRIKSHYSQTYNNNTIICRIKKGDIIYSISKTFTFGPSGTAGTDYTFLLDFNEGQNALTVGDDTPVIVRARLYDYEGKEILGLETRNIVWNWINGDSQMMFELPYKENNIIQNNKVELQLGSNFDKELTELELSDLLQTNYCILQATLKKDNGAGNGGWGDYDLKAYLPIPIRTSTKYVAMSGPTEIVYNSRGELDKYFQNPYCLYVETNDKLERVAIYDKWDLFSKDQIKNAAYLPKLQVGTSTENPSVIAYRLRPLNIYVKDTVSALCVIGYIEDKPVWSNPLYIYQNKYGSSIINDWNGELTIDEENNVILAASIAAGKKEQDDNTFSGVLMGDWGDDLDSEVLTGLYGFHHGEQSFGFRQDGTGFIGKADRGRIYLDGENGTIYSAGWDAKLGGMKIDIDNGHVAMQRSDGLEKTRLSKDSFNTLSTADKENYYVYREYQIVLKANDMLVGQKLYTPATYSKASVSSSNYVNNKYYYKKNNSSLSSITSLLTVGQYNHFTGFPIIDTGEENITTLIDSNYYSLSNDITSNIYANKKFSIFCYDLNKNFIGQLKQLDDGSYALGKIVNDLIGNETEALYKFNASTIITKDILSNVSRKVTSKDASGQDVTTEYKLAYVRISLDNEAEIDIEADKDKIFVFLNDNKKSSLVLNEEYIFQTTKPNDINVYDNLYIPETFIEKETYSSSFNFSTGLYYKKYGDRNKGEHISLNELEKYLYSLTYDPKEIYYMDTDQLSYYIDLGVDEPDIPLSIGTDSTKRNRKFYVEWDGTLHATNGEFSGKVLASEIEGGYINGAIIDGGTINGATINGTTINGSDIYFGNGTFYIYKGSNGTELKTANDLGSSFTANGIIYTRSSSVSAEKAGYLGYSTGSYLLGDEIVSSGILVLDSTTGSNDNVDSADQALPIVIRSDDRILVYSTNSWAMLQTAGGTIQLTKNGEVKFGGGAAEPKNQHNIYARFA